VLLYKLRRHGGALPGWHRVRLERLTGFIIPAMAAGELASEELCLLVQAILDH
jgi:hypothetical protein